MTNPVPYSPPVSPACPVPWGAGTCCCSGCRQTASVSTSCGPQRPPGCPRCFLRWWLFAASRPGEVGCWSPQQRKHRCDPHEALSWCLHCPTATPSLHLPPHHHCPEGERQAQSEGGEVHQFWIILVLSRPQHLTLCSLIFKNDVEQCGLRIHSSDTLSVVSEQDMDVSIYRNNAHYHFTFRLIVIKMNELFTALWIMFL